MGERAGVGIGVAEADRVGGGQPQKQRGADVAVTAAPVGEDLAMAVWSDVGHDGEDRAVGLSEQGTGEREELALTVEPESGLSTDGVGDEERATIRILLIGDVF